MYDLDYSAPKARAMQSFGEGGGWSMTGGWFERGGAPLIYDLEIWRVSGSRNFAKLRPRFGQIVNGKRGCLGG